MQTENLTAIFPACRQRKKPENVCLGRIIILY